MFLKNTAQTYGLVAKSFHWVMAILIISLIVIGLVMSELPNTPMKFDVYALHKSFGLLVLWMVGLRIIWRAISSTPQALSTHALWEKLLSKAIHIFLYVAMIGMPLSGWVMSSAGQHPVPFFSIMMPDIVSPNKTIQEIAYEAHEVLANLLIAAIGLHFMGAMKHHLMDKDDTLTRMSAAGFKKIIIAAIVLVSIAIMISGVLKLYSIENREIYIKAITENFLDDHQDEKEDEYSQLNTGQIPVPMINPDTWIIDKAQSALTFLVKVYNTPVEGRFGSFDGAIIFDPLDLSKTKVDITIDLKTVVTGDAERDAQILGEEWFNIADYPKAHFVSEKVEARDSQNFLMVGHLTIADKTMPLTLSFTLDIVQQGALNRAYVKATTSLNRTDFNLGGKNWESEDYVGHNVDVALQLVAEKPQAVTQ